MRSSASPSRASSPDWREALGQAWRVHAAPLLDAALPGSLLVPLSRLMRARHAEAKSETAPTRAAP